MLKEIAQFDQSGSHHYVNQCGAQATEMAPARANPAPSKLAYMMLYNILQLLGWSYILFITVTVTLAGGGPPSVWQVGAEF